MEIIIEFEWWYLNYSLSCSKHWPLTSRVSFVVAVCAHVFTGPQSIINRKPAPLAPDLSTCNGVRALYLYSCWSGDIGCPGWLWDGRSVTLMRWRKNHPSNLTAASSRGGEPDLWTSVFPLTVKKVEKVNRSLYRAAFPKLGFVSWWKAHN